jgi:hypothetical protein
MGELRRKIAWWFPQSQATRHSTAQFTGEELQVKFLSDSEENSLKY